MKIHLFCLAWHAANIFTADHCSVSDLLPRIHGLVVHHRDFVYTSPQWHVASPLLSLQTLPSS